MRLRTRLIIGLTLSAGGFLLWVVLFGDVAGRPGLAIAAMAVGVSLVGHRLPGLLGFAIGIVVGGLVGFVWLSASVQTGPLLPSQFLLAYLLLPAVTYGAAGFVLGRQIGPVALVVIGFVVAVSAALVPPSQDQVTLLAGYVVAPVVVTVFAIIGTNVRRSSPQVEE